MTASRWSDMKYGLDDFGLQATIRVVEVELSVSLEIEKGRYGRNVLYVVLERLIVGMSSTEYSQYFR
jgi:hypothetical protein